MPAKYVCPAALRKNIHPFLMCTLEMKEGVDYNKRENAIQSICAYQHYCPCTKRTENTADYKECYDRKIAPPVDEATPTEEIPRPVEEIKSKTTKGKSRKTAKN